MDVIASYLDRRFKAVDMSKFDLEECGIITFGRKSRFIGIVLDRQVLLLDYKHMVCSRISTPNLGNIPQRVYYRAPAIRPFSVEYLRSYFQENADNPYGLWNYLRTGILVRTPDDIKELPQELTQFPPLFYKKEAATSINELRELVQPGDSFFTYDRTSGLSSLIRKTDRCMWSHVGMVTDTATLVESTTSGIVECDFSRLGEKNLDVAIYRFKTVTAEQQEKMVAAARRDIGKTGYNWYAVIRIYLQLRWHIPYYRRSPEVTPGEIIYGNRLRLIAYA